jgi:hypothetical protein
MNLVVKRKMAFPYSNLLSSALYPVSSLTEPFLQVDLSHLVVRKFKSSVIHLAFRFSLGSSNIRLEKCNALPAELFVLAVTVVQHKADG